jgi:hypothetical protein
MNDIAEILRIHLTSELNETTMDWSYRCREAFLAAAFDGVPCDKDVYLMVLNILRTVSELYRISNMDDTTLLDYTRECIVKLDHL